jgi:hypothetical protein
MAEIGGRLFDVADISLGGIRIKGVTEIAGDSLRFLLCPVNFGIPDRKRGVQVSGTVVGRYEDATAMRFDLATMPLMKLVVHQVSLELGIEPYAVK